MDRKFWEIQKLESIFINDKGHLRFEIVYTLLIILIINVF